MGNSKLEITLKLIYAQGLQVEGEDLGDASWDNSELIDYVFDQYTEAYLEAVRNFFANHGATAAKCVVKAEDKGIEITGPLTDLAGDEWPDLLNALEELASEYGTGWMEGYVIDRQAEQELAGFDVRDEGRGVFGYFG